MKIKGKKLYLTIMALCLAITVMITSSITLAFFGSTAGGTTTIKLGNAVTVDNATSITSQSMYVSPSQMIDIDASALVKSPGDASSTTDAILRAKITNNSIKSANVAVVPAIKVGSDNAYWVKGSDGYFYLVNSQDGDICYTIKTTTTGVNVPMQVSVRIPPTLTNADGGTPYSVNVTFCAVQAYIYNSNGSLMINSIENTKPIFDQVEGTSKLQRIEGNSVQRGTPTPENPVEIQSVGDRTKNLFDIDSVANGTVLINNGDGTYNLVRNGSNRFTNQYNTFIPRNTPITVSVNLLEYDGTHGYVFNVEFFMSDGNREYANFEIDDTEKMVKLDFDVVGIKLYIQVNNPEITTLKFKNLMFEIGESATSYEPYGYKIPVAVGSETYNIYLNEPLRKIGDTADYIDFSTGKLVRNVGRAYMNSDVEVSQHRTFDNSITIRMTDFPTKGDNVDFVGCESNYYIGTTFDKYYNNLVVDSCATHSSYTDYLYIHDSRFSTLTEYQSFFDECKQNGNPVYLNYILKESVTTNIDLSHIPTGTNIAYDFLTEVQPNAIYGE